MSDKEQKINMDLDKCEYRFIKWSREVGYARIDLEIREGQPKIIYKGISTTRFDVDNKS